MFADSLSDSGWSNHSRRGWITLISLALQALSVGCLLFLPLIYTEGLPRLALLAPLLAPAPPPAAPPPVHPHPNSDPAAQSNLLGSRLMAPQLIPPTVTMLSETVPPRSVEPSMLAGACHGVGAPYSRSAVLDSILGSGLVVPPPPPAVRHPPTSRMMEGNLLHRVQPGYPTLARQVRVQGQVVLRAIISREGTIENLQVLSGHPMLVQAAVNAVRQWRYRPYVLNGEPVEVETQVTVNFVLSGG